MAIEDFYEKNKSSANSVSRHCTSNVMGGTKKLQKMRQNPNILEQPEVSHTKKKSNFQHTYIVERGTLMRGGEG